MQRIQHSTAVADKFGPGKPGFTSGDPQAQVAATVVTSDFLDWIQEELARAVEVFGPLDAANLGQLAAALQPLAAVRTQTRSVQLSALPLVWETAVGGTGIETSYWKFDRWKYDYPQGYNQAKLRIDLTPYLEPRGNFSKASFRVSTSSRSGSSRLRCELYRQTTSLSAEALIGTGDPNKQRTTLLASAYATDGVGGEQLIELTPATAVGTAGMYAVITACTGTPPVGDALLAVGVEYTKQGF